MIDASGDGPAVEPHWQRLLRALTKLGAQASPSDLDAIKKELDIVPENECGSLLGTLVPWCIGALNTVPVSFVASERGFALRESVLDTFSHLSGLGDYVRPHLDDIMANLIKILYEDNELNGLAAMHIFMEFHKVFRGAVESSVQPFIDFVLQLLDSFPSIAKNLLSSTASGGSETVLVRAAQSVKIIIESPVMVVLLFQLHRRFINDNILKFVPLVMKILEISIPAPVCAHDARLTDDLSQISGQIKSRVRQDYCDFVQAKVKVLSFLAYVSRSFSSALKPNQHLIPLFVIDILKNCPPESASARKELLVAVRHILATDLRQAFVPQFETLLDEDLLFGTGYTSSNVMRPLVFSTIADLVHHIRLDLPSRMIVRVVDMYSQCFHDPTLPYGIQTMSAKLLLNLMDCVNGEKMDPELRRPITMKILSVLLCKYRRLAHIVEEINHRRFDGSRAKHEKAFDIYWEDPWKSRTICSDVISADSGRDNIRDIKFVMKTITAGVKSIVLSFKTNYISFNPDTDAPAHPTSAFTNSCNFSLEESKLFVDMFRDGVACFDICQTEVSAAHSGAGAVITSIASEDKELVDQFAYIFTLLDPYIFQDVLSAHVEYLFDKIVKNPLLLIIPQYFLAIGSVSRSFAGILIKFLMDKFELVGESSVQGSALLRLFKLVFLAVSVYPDENEHMILPYISDIIINCLRQSQKTPSPTNYFLLLKALFRGIAGGRFEHLYKEVLPILPLLLETLNRLATNTTDRQMRDLYVELCLTTPVRLSVLLPYLPYLMKPLVLSLTSETELVNQGLRTLELCVDNLTQDFLEPILAPVLPQLLSALWTLLRPAPANQSHAQFALRILGKFGGRGRRFLKYPLKLDYKASSGAELSLVFGEAEQLSLSLDALVDLCLDYFQAPQSAAFHGLDAGQLSWLLRSCLSAVCGFDVSEPQRLDRELLAASVLAQDGETRLAYDEAAIVARLNNQSRTAKQVISGNESAAMFKRLLMAAFHSLASADADIAVQARQCLENICDRFIAVQLLAQRNQAKDYSFTGLTPNLFLDVLADVISGPSESLSESALSLLTRIYDRVVEHMSLERISELPLFFLLVERLIAFCYGPEFYRKMGTCKGLRRLCDFGLGVRWMWVQESRIVRGLLYILKDMPAYVTRTQTQGIAETLLSVLRQCHSSTATEDGELKSKSQYYFNQIMSILISELTNSNGTVRDVVHSSLELLAQCNGCLVGELLLPNRDRLLLPIFAKPLRALPFSLQIGYVDAVNYCLNMKPPLVSFSEELLRLLHEALALVEADDTALVSKSGQLKNAQNLINLRVVCISLLSNAISCVEFQDPKMHQIRNHIVSAFFKSLYSKSADIVAVARRGLELVILHQQKLPKDLLQHGLRPVLINLAEAKRLTLSGLEGLSKVLQLLTSYFKAEIGKKLLDHIGIWAEQRLMEELSAKPLLESMEVKVIVAILDVFHLLPPSANLFLEELVATVGRLDTWTKRTRSSPFRPPLFKFMYKHPVDSVAFLLANPQSLSYCELFETALVADPTAALLGELIREENMIRFFDLFFRNRTQLARQSRAISVRILTTCVQHRESEPSSSVKVREALLALLAGGDEDHEAVLTLLFAYMSHHACDMDMLLALFAALDSPHGGLDSTWIPKRIRDDCIANSAPQTKRELLLASLDCLASEKLPSATKARLIRFLLLPLIARIKAENSSISDIAGLATLQRIDRTVLSRVCLGLDRGSCTLSLEEIQLVCGVIAVEPPAALKTVTSAIRRFLVNRNMSPDPVVRYSALFAACHYICELKADFKFLDAILKSALNIPTSEVRPLLRQTLSVSLPCLLARASKPLLTVWLPEVLMDLSKNSHFLTVISVFWSNIVVLEDQLVQFKDALVRPLIVCLSKAALTVLSVPENRSIPFDVARVALNWIKDGLASLEDAFLDQFLHTLIKMIMLFADGSAESRAFAANGLDMLSSLTRLLRDEGRSLKLRYEHFSRSMPPFAEATDEAINSASLFVRVVATVAEGRSDAQFLADCESLQRFIHFCLTSCNEHLVAEICPLFSRLCSRREDAFEDLFAALQQFLGECLQNSRAVDCTLSIMTCMHHSKHVFSEALSTAFMRAFQKICRDHTAKLDQSGDVVVDEASLAHYAKGVVIPAMKLAHLCFCGAGSSSKSPVYGLFRTLWEQTRSADILKALIEMLRAWLECPEEIADFREKADILSTPSRVFEVQNDGVIEGYLELVLIVYSSPRLRTTDLTLKLEGAFLFGLCYGKKTIRQQFVKLIDELIPRKVDVRLMFVFSSQRWGLVANCYWIAFAVDFILSAWPREIREVSCLTWPLFSGASSAVFSSASMFAAGLSTLLSIVTDVLHGSDATCHKYWLRIFPQIWELLPSGARDELIDSMVKVMADPDFMACSLNRPNAIKTVLDGIATLAVPPEIPNHLISYVGAQYGAWYSACVVLESNLAAIKKLPKNHDYSPIKDLCQLYEKLGEFETSSGLVRRYAIFPETNIALSFEQNSQWITAQKMHEKAQLKARNGSISFFEDEFAVWENHWELCARKLQQWDLLAEVAKVDNNTNLSLECEWVLNDWSRSETKSHIETLLGQVKEDNRQKKLMEAFMVLNHPLREAADKLVMFQSSMDAVLQDAIVSWAQLPEHPTPAHNAALEHLQIVVELQESQSFFANAPNSINRPQFLQELKALLSTWRDRLPNGWEDTGVWSNLLAWRQHVFTAINAVFHTGSGAGDVGTGAAGAPASSTTHPFAYRGYHETAWLINRFAHVARKNALFDVSLSFLNKIYTLPNIEIQDAFLKLREQAKCYMESPSELPTALEVINATNLNYFNSTQKAEFFTLKAIVLSRLGMIDEANRIFAQAVQIDLNIAKGWSSWGYFNDQRFLQAKDITFGVNAVNCYLQAATLCKNASARKYLARVLWLLTFEDGNGSMSKSFELYNHDLPSWYWVPFIPELLASLTRREARQARFLLMKIAKSYPQALYLQLRTAHDEFRLLVAASAEGVASTQSESKDAADRKFAINSPNQAGASIPGDNGLQSIAQPPTPTAGDKQSADYAMEGESSLSEQPYLKKSLGEHIEDLMGILKTGYPLLALSIENMVEHIIHRLRSSPEEDLYRIITTLVTENMQQTMIKLNANISDQTPSPMTVVEASLKKVAEMLAGSSYLAQKFKSSFENDFLRGTLTLTDVMDRLQRWKHQLSTILDKLPNSFHLENFSRYLAEFEHQRYDEIDVPGQYLVLRDAGADFVKLDRFDSQVEIVRRHGTSFRRIVMIGNDGSRTPFIVQNPASRQSRREERVTQLLRMADSIVDKKIIAKRHSLSFNIQSIVPLSSFVRLIQDNSSFVSLEEVYEQHCRQTGIAPEDPVLYFRDCMYKGIESLQIPFKKGSVDLLNLRVDLFEEVCRRFVPQDILSRYVRSTYRDFGSFWNFRHRFTAHYASFVFMTYVLAIGHRFPHKIGFAHDSASLVTFDLLPALNQSGQFTLTEAVPFRLTPNLQHFLTDVGVEGPFTSFIMALGQALSGKKQDFSDYLMLYVRDEVLNWTALTQGTPLGSLSDDLLSMQSETTGKIFQNVEIVMKRVQALACCKEQEKGAESLQPLDQTILDLISCAANPQKLAHMDAHWHPWL